MVRECWPCLMCKFVGFCYAYLNLDEAMSTFGVFWRLEQQQIHGRQVLKIPQVYMLYVYTICVHVFTRWARNSYKWSDGAPINGLIVG